MRAEALAPFDRYGAVVPVRFAVRNDGTAPVFVLKMDALTGRRWLLASLAAAEPTSAGPRPARRGLLLPGQELSFESPYRLIAEEERLVIDVETVSDPVALPAAFPGRDLASLPPEAAKRALSLSPGARFGDFVQVGAVVRMPSLPVPFEPRIREMQVEAWTYCEALGGFVVRVSSANYILITPEGRNPLPPVDFDFLMDLDRAPGGVPVRTIAGEDFTVTAGNALPWLRDQILAGLRVVAAGGDGGPRYATER